MGVFKDLFTLMKAGAQQSANTDYVEALRQSAKLAEQYSEMQSRVNQGGPVGSHGAATANPFVNMGMYASMIQGNGRVIALRDSGRRMDDEVIYDVDLEVTMPDRPPYPAVYSTVIALGALPHWQPGALFPFRADPNNPTTLMLG